MSAYFFDVKLVNACDELSVFQNIEKSTGFRGEQYSLLYLVLTKDPTEVSGV